MRILFAGESWMSHTIHVKGFDSFTTSTYSEGVKWIKEAFEHNGHTFEYIPGQDVSNKFPFVLEDLLKYDIIILSDIGANTFLLNEKTFNQSVKLPNRLELIREYVNQGGAFLMIGGYLTFSGIDGKAKYHGTAVEECLPVILKETDDRREIPQGGRPAVIKRDHEIFDGIEGDFPEILGYNQFKAKENTEVLMKIFDDPFLVVGSYGKGKTAAFATDCSPHWAPPEFVDWKGYRVFWNNILTYLKK